MTQLYRQLSELMGGMLPQVLMPSNDSQALDIGWGMGESVYEIALRYPSLHITGIDMDISVVKQAQALVNELANVTVSQQNIVHYVANISSTTSFDLIHLHFLAGEVPLQVFPTFIQSIAHFCNSDGLLVWTEAELPITTSLACQHLCSLVLQGLKAKGHMFSHGNSMGLTVRMGSWLKDAGCHITQSKAHAIDLSKGSIGNEAFVTQMGSGSEQICAFLLETGVTTVAEFKNMFLEMQQEIQEQQFRGLLYLRTLIGRRV